MDLVRIGIAAQESTYYDANRPMLSLFHSMRHGAGGGQCAFEAFFHFRLVSGRCVQALGLPASLVSDAIVPQGERERNATARLDARGVRNSLSGASCAERRETGAGGQDSDDYRKKEKTRFHHVIRAMWTDQPARAGMLFGLTRTEMRRPG